MAAKRIAALDIMRGLGIMVIVVIHRIHYDWLGMADRAQLHRYLAGPLAPLIVGTIVLFTMAGIFYLISGLVNAYSLYIRAESAQKTTSRVMQGGIVTGLWFLLWNYLQRLFFMNGFVQGPGGAEPEFPAGLLTGWLRQEGPVVFRWSQLTEPGTLSVIGIILMAVSVVLGILFRRDGLRRERRIYATLGWLGGIALALSPFAKYLLMPSYITAYKTGQYALAWLLGPLCQEFGIFPYLGYGLLGAVTGIALARQEPLPQIRRRNRKFALILLAAGVIGIVAADRHTALGERIIGACISYLELAVFLFLTGWAIKFWDEGEEARVARRQQRFTAARRFGMVAFTVYLCEPLLAALIKLGLNAAFGTAWTGNLLLVLAFGFLCLAVWWGLLALWGRWRYAGSLEWLSAAVLRKLARKEIGENTVRDAEFNHARAVKYNHRLHRLRR